MKRKIETFKQFFSKNLLKIDEYVDDLCFSEKIGDFLY